MTQSDHEYRKLNLIRCIADVGLELANAGGRGNKCISKIARRLDLLVGMQSALCDFNRYLPNQCLTLAQVRCMWDYVQNCLECNIVPENTYVDTVVSNGILLENGTLIELEPGSQFLQQES